MKTKNALILFLTAFIWGTAFVAHSVGMDHLGPFAFNGIRNFIASAALLPCIWLLDKLKLQYNHMRQSAITQEITEVASGAKRMKSNKTHQ